MDTSAVRPAHTLALGRRPGTSPQQVRDNVLRQLSASVTKPTPWLILHPLAHVAVVIGLLVAARSSASILGSVAIALVIGHSYFCIGNFGHYLSHRSIIKSPRWCYIFEYLFWALMSSSATVWAKAHNNFHHRYTNGKRDTFRYFAESERTRLRYWIHLLLSPNRQFKLSPFVFLTYIVTHSAYLSGALTGKSGTGSSVVAYVPEFTRSERIRVWLECAGIVVVQLGLYVLLGQDLGKYLVITVVALITSSAIASIYLFTQHTLFPLSEDNDPLRNTTSIAVHPIIDFIHLNVSYHVEHHVLASVSPVHYPRVSAILQKDYPDLYMRVPISSIWRRIYDAPIFKKVEQS